MRRQPWLQNSALAVVAFVFFVTNAQAAAPSYDEGYGGGKGDGKPSEGDGTPCYNDGYGAPCSDDDLVAGAELPYDGGIKRILATSVSRDDYGSSTDYGSEDGLLPCTCLDTWTAYERDAGNESASCGLNNHGCPQTACDGDDKGPWCKVVHSPCLEEENKNKGGWAYCAPICDTHSWVDHGASVLGDPNEITLEYSTGMCDSTKQPEECEDMCKLDPFCSGLLVLNVNTTAGVVKQHTFLKNTHAIDKKQGHKEYLSYIIAQPDGAQWDMEDGSSGYRELKRGKGPCEDKEQDRPDNRGGDDDDHHHDDDRNLRYVKT